MEGSRRSRRRFTAEYKVEVVALCGTRGQTVAGVARDLDPTETAVRRSIAASVKA